MRQMKADHHPHDYSCGAETDHGSIIPQNCPSRRFDFSCSTPWIMRPGNPESPSAISSVMTEISTYSGDHPKYSAERKSCEARENKLYAKGDRLLKAGGFNVAESPSDTEAMCPQVH
ncbi:hypothetical protein NPIL_463961 [Nephila pilipes]|uniref:Uncharacterized protein n=1 Tax=Nephila pilipes TaxID=299642 RepID=A0A8X6PCP5_NEPPI|nr:hypothetical protein NPIL_463961 [Nephila pilipes]